MRHPEAAVLCFLTAALVLAGGAAWALLSGPANGQEPQTSLAVDADPTGNTATSLGVIDSSVSVRAEDEFDVDIVVRDITDLLAWEIRITYDPDVLEVTARDVMLFQAANEGSAVMDVSQDVPDTDGKYVIGAVDTADPSSPDSGSGVLGRLTFKAKAPGTSPLTIAKIDLNDDGVIDQGPLLRAVAGDIIGDEDGDTMFDGPITDAEVRVSAAPEEQLTVTPSATPAASDGDGGGVSAVAIIAAILGGVALVAATGGYFLLRRRGHAARGP